MTTNTKKDPIMEMIDFFFAMPFQPYGSYRKTNVDFDDESYRLQLSVPGLSKEDIKIQIKNSVLIVSHETEEKEDKKFTFTDNFRKEYTLPDDVNEKGIKGKLEKGILEITIPRDKKKSNERTVTIE